MTCHRPSYVPLSQAIRTTSRSFGISLWSTSLSSGMRVSSTQAVVFPVLGAANRRGPFTWQARLYLVSCRKRWTEASRIDPHASSSCLCQHESVSTVFRVCFSEILNAVPSCRQSVLDSSRDALLQSALTDLCPRLIVLTSNWRTALFKWILRSNRPIRMHSL